MENHRSPLFALSQEIIATREAFIRDIAGVINTHSMENGSNTADFILAEYLYSCLLAFDAACATREQMHHAAQYVPGPNDEQGPRAPFVSSQTIPNFSREKAP